MKLQPDKFDTLAITGHGPGWVAVNGEKVHHSVVVGSGGAQAPWHCDRFEDLTESHFEQLANMQPEVVLFGSGERLRFAPPRLLRALLERRIGVETMDTQAACRTYNILAGEGRQVVVALLIERQTAKNDR